MVSSSGEKNTPPALFTRIDTVAEFVDGALQRGVDLFAVADVDRDAQCANAFGGRRAGVGVTLPDRDRGAERRQSRGDTPADARSPSGDDRDAAGEQDVGRIDGHRSRLARLGLARPHRRSIADHALGFQVGDLLVGESEFGQQFMVVLTEQRRGLRVDALRAARERERQRAVRCAGIDRMPDVLEEPAGRQLRQSRSGGAVASPWPPAHRSPTACRRSRRRCGPRTTPQGARRCRRGGRACPRRYSDRRIRRPVAAPERLAKTRPLLVGRDRDRDPAVGAAELVDLVGAVQVLRRRRRSAVAVAFQQRTVSGVLDHLLGGDVERRVDHRRLDQHPLPGAAAVLQGQQQRVECVDAGVRVTDRIGLVRVAVGITGEPTDSGRRLDDVGERRVVAPRAVEAETRASAA